MTGKQCCGNCKHGKPLYDDWIRCIVPVQRPANLPDSYALVRSGMIKGDGENCPCFTPRESEADK